MSRTRGLAFTGFVLSEVDRDKIVELCRRSGAVGFEGSPPQVDGMSRSAIEDLAEFFDQAGITIDTFHLPFGRDVDVASFYETDRRAAVRSITEWIDRAAALGAKAVIQHPASSHAGTDVEGVSPFLDKLCASLETLLPHAEKNGVRVAVENMLPGRGCNFGCLPEHLAAVAERMAHPALAFCLDTGHAAVSRGIDGVGEFFDACGDLLTCFHLSDTAGDRDMHIAPGRGNVDWTTVFARAAELPSEIAMCIEVPPFAWGPPYADEAWAALIADTRALMNGAHPS